MEPAPDVAATLGLGESSHSRWRSGRIAAGAAITFGALVAVAMAGSLWRSDAPVSYRTELVAQGPLVSRVSATGALAPLTEVDVGTEVSGIVDAVYVDFNQPVMQGQVLARMNTERIEAAAEQARANLTLAEAQRAEARASVLQAEADLGRRKRVFDLSGGETPSQSDLDAAQAAYDRAVARERSATAQIAQAHAALDGHLSDLRRAEVVSPIDGIVLDRRVEAGQTVAAAFQTPVLFSLAGDLRQMQLSVDVDEADVGRVREGQESSFTVDAHPDRSFHARVAEIRFAPRSVGGVVTYEAILDVDNGELHLRPGMTATAQIIVDRIDDALLVPNAGLRFTPSSARRLQEEEAGQGMVEGLIPRPTTSGSHRRGKVPRVWVLRDEAAVPVDLETGASDGTWTAVTKGELRVGDVVIIDEHAKADS